MRQWQVGGRQIFEGTYTWSLSFFGLPKTLYTCTLNKACLCSTQRKISVNLSQQRLSDKKLSPF